MKFKKTFPVTIYSPFQTYYDGPALLLQAENKTGPFDILADHANFLCLLSPGVMRVQAPDKTSEFTLDKGILQVVDGAVFVFANI